MTDSASELRAAIEGLYILKEWHSDAKVFRPPQVEGRFVILGGSIVAISVDKMNPPTQVTVSEFGVCSLENGSFAYRWDHRSKFTEVPGRTEASHALSFEGMRHFSVKADKSEVKFISVVPDQAEICFASDKLRYLEGGRLLRIWERSR